MKDEPRPVRSIIGWIIATTPADRRQRVTLFAVDAVPAASGKTAVIYILSFVIEEEQSNLLSTITMLNDWINYVAINLRRLAVSRELIRGRVFQSPIRIQWY